jgi:dTDP-glucose pyrophosphorylase
MNFVITMAGIGSRFKKAGFKKVKMLLEAHGKTLLEWSVNSLPLELCTNLIFIGLKEHNDQYGLQDFIKNRYKLKDQCMSYDLNFLWLKEVTRGQAETVYKAKELVNFNTDLLIFNIDTFFISSTLKKNLLINNIDGVLGAFRSNEDRFSYAKLNDAGYVVETAEKEVISNYALTGMYHFKYPKDFFDVCEYHIENEIFYKNEFYIAPMYNELIKKGKKIIIDVAEEQWILGTPEEYWKFIDEYIR